MRVHKFIQLFLLGLSFFLVQSNSTANASENAPPVRLPLCIDDTCSFVDQNGAKVLTGYGRIKPFAKNGLALVFTNEDQYSFIDYNGKVVIDLPTGWYGNSFADNGLARIRIVNEGYTFIDKTGLPISDLRFKNAEDFDAGGLALVGDEDHYGFLGEDGKLAIPLQLDYTSRFSDFGLALSWSGKSVGFIDRTGQWAVAPTFSDASEFSSHGYAEVSTDDGDYALKSDGTLVAELDELWRPRKWYGLHNLSHGLFASSETTAGKQGYKDIDGNWVIPPQFDYAYAFAENGRAKIRERVTDDARNVRYGFIDRSGTWIVEPKFEDACQFNEIGLAAFKSDSVIADRRVTKPGKWGFIDEDGTEIVPALFESCGKALDARYMIVEFGFRKDYFGVIDADGKMYGFTDEDVIRTSQDWRE